MSGNGSQQQIMFDWRWASCSEHTHTHAPCRARGMHSTRISRYGILCRLVSHVRVRILFYVFHFFAAATPFSSSVNFKISFGAPPLASSYRHFMLLPLPLPMDGKSCKNESLKVKSTANTFCWINLSGDWSVVIGFDVHVDVLPFDAMRGSMHGRSVGRSLRYALYVISVRHFPTTVCAATVADIKINWFTNRSWF